MDFWEYHTRGDRQCKACVAGPTGCELCEGLVHTHLNDELDAVEAKCDQCERVEVPEAVE